MVRVLMLLMLLSYSKLMSRKMDRQLFDLSLGGTAITIISWREYKRGQKDG